MKTTNVNDYSVVDETVVENDGQTAIAVDETASEEKPKKKQAVSISYTLKSFKENINKFRDAELVTKEQADALDELHKEIAVAWVMKM